jgi:hypothetical protein
MSAIKSAGLGACASPRANATSATAAAMRVETARIFSIGG